MSDVIQQSERIFEFFSETLKFSTQKEVFKTLSFSAMKIEAAICLFTVRFQKTFRLYVLKIACMTENHSIKQRTLITFLSEYQTEINLNENKFLD